MPNIGKTKILVIDSEQRVLSTLQKGLEFTGATVSGFTDPIAALEDFEASDSLIVAGDLTPYDIVVTDARMPGMTGFQIARWIKKIRPETKVILMSQIEMSKSEFEKVMPSTQIDGFLCKPFPISKLVEVIFAI